TDSPSANRRGLWFVEGLDEKWSCELYHRLSSPVYALQVCEKALLQALWHTRHRFGVGVSERLSEADAANRGLRRNQISSRPTVAGVDVPEQPLAPQITAVLTFTNQRIALWQITRLHCPSSSLIGTPRIMSGSVSALFTPIHMACRLKSLSWTAPPTT